MVWGHYDPIPYKGSVMKLIDVNSVVDELDTVVHGLNYLITELKTCKPELIVEIEYMQSKLVDLINSF